MFGRRHLMAALTGGKLLLSAASAQAAEKLTVFAAASVKNALDAAGARWEAGGGAVSYAASSAQAKQIGQGAPAGIFFSANLDWMKAQTIFMEQGFTVLTAPATN